VVAGVAIVKAEPTTGEMRLETAVPAVVAVAAKGSAAVLAAAARATLVMGSAVGKQPTLPFVKPERVEPSAAARTVAGSEREAWGREREVTRTASERPSWGLDLAARKQPNSPSCLRPPASLSGWDGCLSRQPDPGRALQGGSSDDVPMETGNSAAFDPDKTERVEPRVKLEKVPGPAAARVEVAREFPRTSFSRIGGVGLSLVTFNIGNTDGGGSGTPYTHQQRIILTADVLNAAIGRALKRGAHVIVCLQECQNFYLSLILARLLGGMKLATPEYMLASDGRPILYSSGIRGFVFEHCWHVDLLKWGHALVRSDGECSESESQAEPRSEQTLYGRAARGNGPNEFADDAPQAEERGHHRSLTLARFRATDPQTGAERSFVVANVHILCAGDKQMRHDQQSRLIRVLRAHSQGRANTTCPLFMLGDFNESHNSEFPARFEQQSNKNEQTSKRARQEPKEGPGWASEAHSLWAIARTAGRLEDGDGRHGWRHGTYHGWGLTELTNGGRMIDFALVSKPPPSSIAQGAISGSELEGFARSGVGEDACQVEVLSAGAIFF